MADARNLMENQPCQEAVLYQKLSDGKVHCQLCSHRCLIPDGHFGLCGVRVNRSGTLYTLVYGKTLCEHIDPIEKKPLYHFYPGSAAYSIATPGCNFDCRWCQNWESVHVPPRDFSQFGHERLPAAIAGASKASSCRSIAYTYTEPTVYFEYAYDIAREARKLSIANIFVTNGFMTLEALKRFQPFLDAANVDLKSFRDKTYRLYTGGQLEPILEAMKAMKKMGVWLEVTTLVIPGLNDSDEELRDAARFIARELDVDTPWHISRFFSAYKMTDRPATAHKILTRAREIGVEEGLRYVYIGNTGEASDTFCPQCGRGVIQRHGYSIRNMLSPEGRCPYCGAGIAGVGLAAPTSKGLI